MIKIKTCSKGAELISLKFNGEEKLHDGLNFWNRHSPILFPIVGQIKDNKTIIEGKEYSMTQHGLARDMEFKQVEENYYVLEYNEETLKKFPYKFELHVWYESLENSLIVNYKVINKDNKNIMFGLGAHPAFKCDYANGKYSIEFEKKEDNIEILELENGLISNKQIETQNIIKDNKIKLNKDSFINDAIIMKNIKSDKVFLKYEDKEILNFEFEEFPYLAIWSKVGANFVCIEPWFNTADKIDATGEFKDKENIIVLEKDKEFSCKYKINFKNS